MSDVGEAGGGDKPAPAEKKPARPDPSVTKEADEESAAAEVMEDEGGLGWLLLLVIIAAAVGVAAYLVFK
jgi:hypothetical protein